MINDYANQSMTLKTAGTPNEYNEPTYATSTIKGRKEHGIKLVRNAQGEETVSSAVVFTASVVSVNDLIDDAIVIDSQPMPNLDGTTQFYEVYLR
jgi:hypothetical protein